MDKPEKFPETIYVAHYDHSREDSISLSACLTQKEAIEVDTPPDGKAVAVGEYRLVSTKFLAFNIVEKVER